MATVRDPPSEPGDDHDEIWDHLAGCHRRIRAELRGVVLRHGIYLTEYRALARLHRAPRTLGDLGDSLGLTPAAMTDLARQLTRRRWVRRERKPGDRRSTLLRINPTGARVHSAARREYRARLAQVRATIPAATAERLGRDLFTLEEALRAAARPGPAEDGAARPSRGHRGHA